MPTLLDPPDSVPNENMEDEIKILQQVFTTNKHPNIFQLRVKLNLSQLNSNGILCMW